MSIDPDPPVETPMTFEMSRGFDRNQVAQFAAATGDRNLLHLDESFARRMGHPTLVVHGMLTFAFAESVVHPFIGAYLPRAVDVRFRSPLYIDAPVRYEFRPEGPQSTRLAFTCLSEGRMVLEGAFSFEPGHPS